MPTTHEPGHRLRTALRLATTTALAATCAVLSFLLWQARREIQRPPPGYSMVLDPAEPSEEIRSGAGAETADSGGNGSASHFGPPADRQVFRPPHAHRIVLTLELPASVRDGSGADGVGWAAEVLPPPGEGPGFVERAVALGSAVRVELEPEPAPGPYRVNLYRFEGQKPERVARYGFRIGLPEEVPPER